MDDSREITNLTYKVFQEVHNLNSSKEMKFEEVKSKIEIISANIIQAEEKGLNDLTDIELQENIMRELIFDYCVAKNYEVDEFPFKQFKKIENNEPGYDEDYFSWQHTEYYLDKLTLEKKDIFELRKIALQKYYPNCSSQKIYEHARLCIKLADKENFSFDVSHEEIEEATTYVKPERPKLP
ncbi:hypothetical protein [Salegentibacter salegens]|uniref:Uncharacterized protein n=1 Tax=Salegentibacter salegens TaxID=143223 RepID=A0A1M7H7P7_9FLAO|nr:hypothetical protein [Salegentibacter salegens]PRX38762.1 hypothetical protein LY58_03472 [Salegentibacter salegens]SHM24500.1 hypothetical protein SAMN05878281_0015 [Salegentibacter salegens]SHM30255.1 hypothetical protein SAMN05878281_0217 [Salegentibacter salegens]